MKKTLSAIILGASLVVTGSVAADELQLPLAFSLEAHVIGMELVGLVPEGLRFDVHVDIELKGDRMFGGATGSAIDYLLVRHDGVLIADVRAIGVLVDGTPFAYSSQGIVGDPTIVPPLEAWLDPEFESPDMDLPYHLVMRFQTMAPQYAFVHYTVFGCRGTVNPGAGVVRFNCDSLAD